MDTLPLNRAKILLSPSREEDRYLPESPRSVTLDDREAIMWVNIQSSAHATAGDIHFRFWDNGEVQSLLQKKRPGFVLPTDVANHIFVGMEKQLGVIDCHTNQFKLVTTIPDDNPRTIINDVEILPGGKALVFGTKDVEFSEPLAHLYLFTLEDRKITTLADKQTCSNGKVFRAEGNQLFLYDIDTPKRNIVRYLLDVEKRTATFDKVVVDLSRVQGFPDGMADCGDGTVIVCIYNPHTGGDGRTLRILLESGQILEEWITDGSPRVTCPWLIRIKEKIYLILTTCVEGMSADMRKESPNAGSLFYAETRLGRCGRTEIVRFKASS